MGAPGGDEDGLVRALQDPERAHAVRREEGGAERGREEDALRVDRAVWEEREREEGEGGGRQ